MNVSERVYALALNLAVWARWYGVHPQTAYRWFHDGEERRRDLVLPSAALPPSSARWHLHCHWSKPVTPSARQPHLRRCEADLIQDDLEAFQEPPPKEWRPAFICQVPCMEVLVTEPE